jgi:hypothetical protein
LANSVVARIIWGVIQAHRVQAENLRVSFVHDLYIILCLYYIIILYYVILYYILFYMYMKSLQFYQIGRRMDG